LDSIIDWSKLERLKLKWTHLIVKVFTRRPTSLQQINSTQLY